MADTNEKAIEELKKKGVTFYDIDIRVLKDAYQKEADRQGFAFNQEWQQAIDEVIAQNPVEEKDS